MDLIKWYGMNRYLYSRAAIQEPMTFHVKFPAPIVELISTKRKLIVKLADGQIRYMKKTRKNKFKLFSYNT